MKTEQFQQFANKQWQELIALLPEQWQEWAWSSRAMQRESLVISSASQLLQLIFAYAIGGYSLRTTAAQSTQNGFAELSDVALLKRLRKSGNWLTKLCTTLAEDHTKRTPTSWLKTQRRIRVLDGTSIQKPGAKQTTWRLHYTIDLPSLSCDAFQLTDEKVGESFKWLSVQKGDVIIADRGYCHREGIAHILKQQGDVIVRLNSATFPMLNEASDKLDLLAQLRTLKDHDPGDFTVQIKTKHGFVKGRVCAIRKSAHAAEQAKRKIKKESSKRQKPLNPRTLEFAEYIFIFTTLNPQEFHALEVLELYRTRWQVELVFKKLKSLLKLGTVPCYKEASSKAWIQAKLLAALLIDKLSAEAAFFPWGFRTSKHHRLAFIHCFA